MIVIVSLGTSIVLFLCAFLGFREGLRLGIQTAKGVEPPKLTNPVKAIQQIKQEHEQSKADKKYAEDLAKLMNYTGEVEDE